jgi:hypothetical protein
MTASHFSTSGKLRMHWLGPYEVKSFTDGGVVQLQDLAGMQTSEE